VGSTEVAGGDAAAVSVGGGSPVSLALSFSEHPSRRKALNDVQTKAFMEAIVSHVFWSQVCRAFYLRIFLVVGVASYSSSFLQLHPPR